MPFTFKCSRKETCFEILSPGFAIGTECTCFRSLSCIQAFRLVILFNIILLHPTFESLIANFDHQLSNCILFLQSLERLHHMIKLECLSNDWLEVVCLRESHKFGRCLQIEGCATLDYSKLACSLSRLHLDCHIPIFAPNSTLGTNSAGIESAAVRIPITLTRPPGLVLLRDFMIVCAPPTSITWSTPFPSVIRSTSWSQSGVFL